MFAAVLLSACPLSTIQEECLPKADSVYVYAAVRTPTSSESVTLHNNTGIAADIRQLDIELLPGALRVAI